MSTRAARKSKLQAALQWRRRGALPALVQVVLASLVGLFCACSEAKSSAKAPALAADHTVLDLLAEVKERQIDTQNPTDPVQVRLFRGSLRPDHLRPGLAMTPPARVRYQLPALTGNAWLTLEPCLKAKAQDRLGLLRYRVRFAGQDYLDQAASCAEWLALGHAPLRIEVSRGGELLLETVWEESSEPAPPAGFAGMVLTQTKSIERSQAGPNSPNLVLIVVDTLRADGLHCYGNPQPLSPNMDALAKRGTLFERAYADSSWTIPSTVSLLTGISPERHGVRGQHSQFLAESLVTIAERCLLAGLETAAFSCNPLVAPGVNFDQGFLHYALYEWQDAAVVLPDIQQWLRERSGARFFLYLHFVDPHDPYLPAEEQRLRFAAQVPENWQATHQLELAKRLTDGSAGKDETLALTVAHNRALYDAEIAGLDATIAHLVRTLDELGELERTVIALTSDHGEEFLEHGLVGHSLQVHEESLHVPLILAGPGVAAGVRHSGLVPIRRLPATMLELAGISAGGFAGEGGLLEQVRSEDYVHSSTVRGMLYLPEDRRWISAGEVHSLRSPIWELHWVPSANEGGEEHVRLWNLGQDPQALSDVAQAQPAIVTQLKAELQRRLTASRNLATVGLSEGEAESERLRAAGYMGEEDEE